MKIDIDDFELEDDEEYFEIKSKPPIFGNNDLSFDYPRQIGKFTKADYENYTEGEDKGFGKKSKVKGRIHCTDQTLKISELQRKAFEYIQGNSSKIEDTILKTILRIAEPSIEALIYNLREEDKDRLNNYIQILQKAENLNRTFVLTSYEIVKEIKNQKSCCVFNFKCSWDKEHGFAVLMVEDEIIEIGGASQFYDY